MVGYRGNQVSRRMFMQMTAAMSAALAAYRAGSAAAQDVTLNILNSNTAWANALTGSVAEAYKGAKIVGESNPYESHYEKMAIELSQGSDTFDIITTDNLWVTQPIRNGWAANLTPRPQSASRPSVEDRANESQRTGKFQRADRDTYHRRGRHRPRLCRAIGEHDMEQWRDRRRSRSRRDFRHDQHAQSGTNAADRTQRHDRHDV